MNILEEREESSDENTSFYNNSQENVSTLDTGYISSSSQETTDYSLSFTSNNTNNTVRNLYNRNLVIVKIDQLFYLKTFFPNIEIKILTIENDSSEPKLSESLVKILI